MSTLPSHWPPAREADLESRVYPLFLLPQVLVPFGLLELMIFEPRYIQMMEDVLDGPGRIVMGAPAKITRQVTDKDLERMQWGVELYVSKWQVYARSFKPQAGPG